MIAIIPARSGSKGLPGKNTRLLMGKPMIAYSIEEAKKSKYISEIIISTNDENIADIAIKYGAKCPFMRPSSLASDKSLVIDSYIYTIEKLNNEFGYKIEDFVVLQPTSPLRVVGDIDSTIEIFKKNNADSAFSFTQEEHPIVWHKYIDSFGKIFPIFEEKLQNRQDVKITYFPNGAVYVFKYETIKKKQYYTTNSYAYVMPGFRSVDVDTIEDFEYAEFLLGKRNEK